MKRLVPFAIGILCASCTIGSGSAWIAEERRAFEQMPVAPEPAPAPAAAALAPAPAPALAPPRDTVGKLVGVFRNTYYDFPRELDYTGPSLGLKSASCRTIASVPRTFYEAVCVQGSGILRRGATVSFAKRDCDCAEVCPRTGQRICFEALSAERFPWGRGAAGRAIVPLETVAADTTVLPLGTPIYIPDFDGVLREDGGDSLHDGCFVVEDRGVRVQGSHVDVFTGHETSTAYLNRVVPSNKGVRVVVGATRCDRLRRSR